MLTWNLTGQGDANAAYPAIIFGIFSVTAGLFSLMLPETLNKKMPESVAEIERSAKLRNRKVNAQGWVSSEYVLKEEGWNDIEETQKWWNSHATSICRDGQEMNALKAQDDAES